MERTIVCLCGSTRFKQAFQDANLKETLAGKIVLSIGCDTKSDDEIFGNLSERELGEVKANLDHLHFDKIEMSDEILVLNVDGYVGQSTCNEIVYAARMGVNIRWLNPEYAEENYLKAVEISTI